MRLNEYAFRFIKKKTNAKGFYASSKTMIPYLVIVGNFDNQDSSFSVFKINSKALEADFKDEYNKKYRGADYNSAITTLYIHIAKLEIPSNSPKRYVTETKVNNKSELAKLLLETFHMDVDIFVQFFGDLDYKSDVKFKSASIIFPDSMKASRREQMLKFLQIVDNQLTKKNLGFLIEQGIIYFKPTGNKAAGLYYENTKQITIDPAASLTSETVRTIIHELGHKLESEYLNSDAKKEIALTFNEVKQTNRHKIILSPTLRHIMHEGAEITYVGRKPTIKKHNPYKITVLTDEKMKCSSVFSKYNLSGTIYDFLTASWEINGIPLTQQVEISSQWFPTNYSQTDHYEWFCELFSYYCLNLLEGEPLYWIESFFHRSGF